MGPQERGGRRCPSLLVATPTPCAMAAARSSPGPGWSPGGGHGPIPWHSAPLTAPARDTPAHSHFLCSSHPVAQSIAETHTLRHATAHIPALLHAFLSSLPLEQSEYPRQTGQWLACWACGTLFALPAHDQPPRCPLCSVRGGLALLQPPLLAPTPEAQLRVTARAHLPSAVWRPLLLFPTTLWRMVLSCTLPSGRIYRICNQKEKARQM